jgi:hypothetical protein
MNNYRIIFHNRILLIAALAFITLFSSCAKEGPTGPQGIAGPAYTGSISGHVSLYDQYGNRVLSGLDSSTVNLTGVTTPTTAATAADVNGLYLFSNDVYTGSYNLNVSHPDYAATQLSNFTFLLGTLIKDVKLSAIPDSFLTSFTAYHNTGSAYDSLVVTVIPNPLPRSCIIFINSNTNVTNNEYTGYLLSIVKAIPANAGTVTILVTGDELTSAGFVSGSSTVYYAAYSYVVNDYSLYEDQATGKNVYNAVNTTPLVSSAITP